MGHISKRLHRKLASRSHDLPTREPKRRPGESLPGGIQDVRTLIRDGFDPIHAAYIFIQQVSSQFAEGVSRWPEMREYAKAVGEAEQEYLPSGPPMSPLTPSYFTTWAFYDLRIGSGDETLSRCQIDANDLIWLNPDQLNALRKLDESRMGIFEHVGWMGRTSACGNLSPTTNLPATPVRATGADGVNCGTSVCFRPCCRRLPTTTSSLRRPTS